MSEKISLDSSELSTKIHLSNEETANDLPVVW